MADEHPSPNGGTGFRLDALQREISEHSRKLDKLTRGLADLLGDADIPGSTGRIERMRLSIATVAASVERVGDELRALRSGLHAEMSADIARALADAAGARLIRNWSGMKKFAFAVTGSVIAGVLIAVIALLLQVAAKLPSPVKP